MSVLNGLKLVADPVSTPAISVKDPVIEFASLQVISIHGLMKYASESVNPL